VLRVTSLTERPDAKQTASRHGIFGRYILTPEIFPCISETRAGRGGEFQLTDSLALYAKHAPIYAYRFEGHHYDAGSKLGFVQATIAYALKDPEISTPLREYLAQIEVGFTSSIQ